MRLSVVVLCFSAIFANAVEGEENRYQKLSGIVNQLQEQIGALEDRYAQVAKDVDILKAPASKQVAFSVTFNSGQVPLDIGTTSAIRYDVIVTNIGNGYNSQDGHFVAPYGGVYAFFCSLRSMNDRGWVSIGIYKGITLLTTATADGSTNPWNRGYAFVTVRLQVGDEVFVKHTAGSTFLERYILTTYSGFLVSPD